MDMLFIKNDIDSIIPLLNAYLSLYMDIVFHEDTMCFFKSDFQRKYLEEIQTLVHNLEENMVEVFDQNIGDLDHSGQNLDLRWN